MEECLIEECLKAPKSRGLCVKHYARNQRKKYGTCTIGDCSSGATNRKGWCAKHYMRFLTHGNTDDPAPRVAQTQCTVDGCDRPFRSRGLCATHYKRWRAHGTTDLPTLRPEMYCRGCKKWYQRAEYDVSNGRCHPCARIEAQDRRPNVRTHRVFRKDRAAMFEAQEGRCAICQRHESELRTIMHIDHDHVTGKARGLLCSECNLGLGKFRDSPAFLASAIAYLARQNSGG